MRKGISVVIPTYNRAQLIKESIQSVLDQKYDGHLEIIISDDGSTDNTMEVLEAFGNKIILVRKSVPDNKQKHGAASARNRGIRASTQPFLCFLDSDDLFLSGHLESMISNLENDDEIGFAFCRSLEFKVENNKKLFRPWTRDHILRNDVKNLVVSRSKINNTNSFIFRRSVFDKVGLFNENYSNGEDGDLWMRISEQFKGKFVDQFGTAYRTDHGAGQLTKNQDHRISECAVIIFKDAQKRYYQLEMRDPKRIFKINHKLLWLKYRVQSNLKVNYYFRYLLLILQFPSGYYQKLKEDYFDKKEKKRIWLELSHYENYKIGK